MPLFSSHSLLLTASPARVSAARTNLHLPAAQLDRGKRRFVVSNRRVLIEEALEGIEPGAVVSGTVKSVKDYGVVVRLDERRLEGLLHVSQVSQVYVSDMAKIFEVGAPVRCVVLKVDPDDGSISLSTKMLEAKPGEMVKNSTALFERAAAAASAPAAADSES